MTHNIIEESLMNGLIENITSAINDVGGETDNIVRVCELPEIIRNQLTAKGKVLPNGVLVEGEGIKIETKDNKVIISVRHPYDPDQKVPKNTEEISTSANLSPTYPKDKDIPAGTSIQRVFEILFDDVLPYLPSVLNGSVIISNPKGYDYYTHERFDNGDNGHEFRTTGLKPDTHYLRFLLANKPGPVYVDVESLIYKPTALTGIEVSNLFDEIFKK